MEGRQLALRIVNSQLQNENTVFHPWLLECAAVNREDKEDRLYSYEEKYGAKCTHTREVQDVQGSTVHKNTPMSATIMKWMYVQNWFLTQV